MSANVPNVNLAPEFVAAGGRIFRHRTIVNGIPRVETFAYTREDGKIKYSASVFRQNSSKESLVKRGQNNTAISRQRLRPVVIDDIPDESISHVSERNDYILSRVAEYGYTGPRS